MSTPPSAAVLRTLLVTDLVDSTRLVAELGDERAFTLFGRHDRLARDLLAAHHGLEIDKTDGFLLLFERPLDAVAYALAYHQALHALASGTSTALAARAGLHLGEVYLRENPPEDVARGAKPVEVEGLAKVLAARLMSLAQGGQTLMTRATFDVARRAAVGLELPVAEVRWVAHGSYLLKGVEEPVEVFEVGDAAGAPLAPPPDSEKAHRVGGDQTIVGWRPAPGQQVPHRDRWTLVEKLGEGGFGEVWLARHTKTGDRLVFKFCFEAERLRGLKREVTLFRLLKEALGDRPDIARVRDWNFDEQPYFLESEYTAGGSLADWAAGKGGVGSVPLATRLEIVAQAAEALAAAHSVGVLHKDLKPTNILIIEDPNGRLQAQLTDFGIGLVTDTSRLAQFGITMGTTELGGTKSTTSGTPKYMAPELLTGRPATVQADVFALGIVLYQLAAGDLDRPLAPGWERDVGDELLREDIAACVDGMPERRLSSAAELAIRLRSLDRRRAALEADRLSHAQAERSRRRRRLLIPAVTALTVFSAAMAIQARRIGLEAARAEREAAAAREVSRFLVDLFDLAGAAGGRGETVTARELLDQGARRMQEAAGGDRLTQARLADAMGVAYLKLGLLGRAKGLVDSALQTRRELLPANHPDLAASLDNAGLLAVRLRQYDQAEKLLGEALAGREKALGMRHPDLVATLEHLALLYREQGRYDLAKPYEERLAGLAPARTERSGAVSPATGEMLSPHHEAALPKDVVRLVGSGPQPGIVLAVGRQGVYLVDLEGAAAPSFTPLAPDEEVVGSARVGELAIRTAGRLVVRNLFPGKERVSERVVAERIGQDELLALDRRSTALARADSTKLRVLSLAEPRRRPLVERRLDVPPSRLTLSARYVAWVGVDHTVHAIELATGREVLAARDWDGQVNALAIDDLSEKLAVGGWFDEVVVYDLVGGRSPTRHVLPGQTHALLFLPDHPTLVVGKEGRLALLREGAGKVAEIEAPAAAYLDLSFGPSGLLVRDAAAQKVISFAYRGLPLERRGAVAGVPIWAIGASEDGRRVLLGTSDGQLHRYDLETSRLESRRGHTQGLTSLVTVGDRVVTASDDKTIAVWDAARLEVVTRSRAHSYLVNYLFWEAATRTLWSTSSDHTIKAWRLPDLVETATIAPGGGSKSALWIDSRRGLAVVGTWERSWMELRRQGSAWTAMRTQRIRSEGAYSVCAHPRADVVLVVGVRPASLWLFDVASGRAWEIEPPDHHLEWAAPFGDHELAVVGANKLVRYSVSRIEGGLDVEVAIGLSTDLGQLGMCAVLPGGTRIAAGNSTGELFVVDARSLPPPLGRIRLR
ncbi:MAG: protein kinase [Thermoanaerobaculaceae bacterium]|nr:protein kinase [Thermoanaerobaculaceae bacterium]MDI9621142.1 protein kinase [Acidobacteriota bacterium]NLH11310.1 protein kinase [Holophagae bacterium]HPW55685.1 protein kinase [Thermoanaerobaculaceae bacterium]